MKRVTFIAGVAFLLLAIVGVATAHGLGAVVHGADPTLTTNSALQSSSWLGISISEPASLALFGCGLLGIAFGFRGKETTASLKPGLVMTPVVPNARASARKGTSGSDVQRTVTEDRRYGSREVKGTGMQALRVHASLQEKTP
jgi:hypothetical protein